MSSGLLRLDLLTEHHEGIRGGNVGDEQRFSVFDFINTVCCKKLSSSYARNVFKTMIEDPDFQDEVKALCVYHVFPGRGQQKTPTMDVRGLQRILFLLGGKAATHYRKQAETTFTRVLAGTFFKKKSHHILI